MAMVPWILGALLVGIVLGAVLGRFAVIAGILIMLLGAAPMAALYAYTEFTKPTRDMSSEGMLSTILFLLVVPVGIVIFLTGIARRA